MHRSLSRLALFATLTAAALTCAAQTAPAPAPVAVTLTPLSQLVVRPAREAPASVVARNQSRLAAEVSGTVQRWHVDLGQSVRRGQVLVQLDPRDAELARQRAQAALAAAEADQALAASQLERARALVAQNFLSREALTQRETDLARTRAAVRSAQVELASARHALSKTTLRAPFDAVVKARSAQTGETVSPGTELYLLVETGHDEVEATLTTADATSLRQSGDARFVDARGQHPLALKRIGTAVTAPARTVPARLGFRTPADAPPPGTSGTLRWSDPRAHLPPDLLVRRNGELGVFVADGGKARFVPAPGAQEGRATPVPTGLSDSASLVSKGQAQLQNGSPVSVAR
ncbi:MAG: efflux RND transporter periplasmic adaptor subunit [Hydrogenophaga sp.]|uniref:efflux RND transporter periplasmic adaptor subunit n=1 Tax=Hydrogenophaga sp. TaxID=1904254 RepID=UPI001D5DEFF9|nr:efflux RND transporter periplasmic adaptor subunit [Hydrogenophaga sp.]MBX3610486.1 efflux RND transporter periplasmic adaptor subunit [Hydrogenophaga sp.]